jgi:hypothetical protein
MILKVHYLEKLENNIIQLLKQKLNPEIVLTDGEVLPETSDFHILI